MSRTKIKVIGIILVLFSFFLTVGAICANAACLPITVSGIVRDMDGQVITGGVTVQGCWGGSCPVSTTTSTTDGSFSLAGVTCSAPFLLKMSSTGYVPVSSQYFMNTIDFSTGVFIVPTVAELTAQGVMPESGKSVLFGRVVDNTYRNSSYVAGAVITATDRSSKTYPVTYLSPLGVLGGSSTYQNGYYFVLNVDAATGASTIVDLQASKTGWTFATPTASFYPFADSAGETLLMGTAPGYDVSVSGTVNDSSGLIYGAGIALHNDGGKNTTAADGSFSLENLPRDATFYLKVEDLATPGAHVPAYVGPITLQESFSNAFFWMYTPAEMIGMGVTVGNGLLMGKVVDTSGTPISGATVAITSRNGASYTVNYYGGGSSTSAVNGVFIVPNVQPGDVVRLDVISASYGFAPVYMDCFGGAVTERTIVGTLFSVDVSRIYYSDSIRTINNYDFSNGTKSGDIITIPAGFVTKPEAESSLSYTFGLYPGTTGLTLSWPGAHDPAYPCTLQSSTDNNHGAAVIATTPGIPETSSAQATWSYGIKLQNVVVESGKINTIRTGMGSPEDNIQPGIEASWLANGDLQLIAKIRDTGGESNIWDSGTVNLTGLTPSATILELYIQNTGSAINFSYVLNGGEVIAIGTYTIPESATILGFPVLFPYVNVEVSDATTSPDSFHVLSAHWNNSNGNKYYANIFVDDLDQATYESISVASSGIPCGDNLPPTGLTYGNGQWWLSPEVFLSENTPPGCFPTFTFTAVKKAGAGGGTVTETRTITGYVEEFAAGLLPTGTVAGTPTFSWTGIAGANGYVVQLSDDAYNQIWNVWVDAPTTQIVYAGPALVSGQTYHYTVNSNVNTNGSTNLSMAEGSFTYSGTIATALYGSFSGAGIWKWDGSDWSQVTPNNPEFIIASGSDLYGSFTGGGIWQWDGSTWNQVTPNNPQMMAVSGSNLYGSFAGGGIWQWDGSTWSQVTPNNPEAMAVSGTALYGDFGTSGIWQWDGSSWSQVTPNNPELMVATSTVLYGSFSGGGIWKWDGSTWSQATPNNPELLVASGENLYGSFAGAGIWKWDGSSWTQTTPNNPQQMVASESILYGSFSGGGIWQWDGTNWSQLTPNEPASMVTGN